MCRVAHDSVTYQSPRSPRTNRAGTRSHGGNADKHIITLMGVLSIDSHKSPCLAAIGTCGLVDDDGKVQSWQQY